MSRFHEPSPPPVVAYGVYLGGHCLGRPTWVDAARHQKETPGTGSSTDRCWVSSHASRLPWTSDETRKETWRRSRAACATSHGVERRHLRVGCTQAPGWPQSLYLQQRRCLNVVCTVGTCSRYYCTCHAASTAPAKLRAAQHGPSPRGQESGASDGKVPPANHRPPSARRAGDRTLWRAATPLRGCPAKRRPQRRACQLQGFRLQGLPGLDCRVPGGLL